MQKPLNGGFGHTQQDPTRRVGGHKALVSLVCEPFAEPGTHRMAPMLFPPSLPLAARVTFSLVRSLILLHAFKSSSSTAHS